MCVGVICKYRSIYLCCVGVRFMWLAEKLVLQIRPAGNFMPSYFGNHQYKKKSNIDMFLAGK